MGVFVRDILLDQVCWADRVRMRAPGGGSAAGVAVSVGRLVFVECSLWVPMVLEYFSLHSIVCTQSNRLCPARIPNASRHPSLIRCSHLPAAVLFRDHLPADPRQDRGRDRGSAAVAGPARAGAGQRGPGRRGSPRRDGKRGAAGQRQAEPERRAGTARAQPRAGARAGARYGRRPAAGEDRHARGGAAPLALTEGGQGGG